MKRWIERIAPHGSNTTVTMSWRDRTANELPGYSLTPLASDVVNLTGTAGDIFVLQMIYLDGGPTEAAQAAAGNIYLTWLDNGIWKNAVAGNIGANTTNPAFLNYQGSWAASGAGLTLGAWGVDTASNSVWAVLDHNSEFAAAEEVLVPEPSAIVLALSGLFTLGCFVRWRGRRRP